MELNLKFDVDSSRPRCFGELYIGCYFIGIYFDVSDDSAVHHICRKISPTQYTRLLSGGYVFEYVYDTDAPNHYQAVLYRNYEHNDNYAKVFELELENVKLKAEIEALKAQLAGLPQPHPQDAVLGSDKTFCINYTIGMEGTRVYTTEIKASSRQDAIDKALKQYQGCSVWIA